MTESMVTKLSEYYEAENRTEIKDLPFIKLNQDQIVFWSVKPSGNYDKDCQIGREYGALALEHMRKADFAPLLTWCIMDMPRKKDCSGIEAGFLEFFAEIAISNFTSNSILCTTYKPKAPDLWLVDKNGNSHFIEIKRSEVSDKPSDEQLVGLAIIEKYLKCPVHLLLLYRADKNIPDDERSNNYLIKFEKFKTLV